jgi:hypothetical protein
VMEMSCSEFKLCAKGRQKKIIQTPKRLSIRKRFLMRIRTPAVSLWTWQIEIMPRNSQ